MDEEIGAHRRLFDILLVEDNPGDIHLAKEAMKESSIPYSLHVVSDGKEAMSYLLCEEKYANAGRPDIIILDLNLPKKTGLEVLKEIKGNLHLKHIPVIVMTTSDAEQDIESAYAFHANCYITKPVDFDKFLKVIKSIIDYWSTIVTLKVA
jgi:chemotaxis family two-component system response regulator Rcp1